MRIALDGNIGIGTTNPTVNLQVSGTIATGDATNGWGRLSYDAGVVRLIGSKNGTDTVDMALSTQASGGTLSEKMRILGSGNVGIGLTNPQSLLHISGSGTQIRITGEGGGNSLVLQGGTGSNMKITGYNYGSSTAVPLYISVDGANTIMQSSGGNVGIGTTNPVQALHVVGGVYTTSNVGIKIQNPTGSLHVVTTGNPVVFPTQGNIGGSFNSRINIVSSEPGIMLNSDVSPSTGTQTGTSAYSLGLQIGFYGVNDVRSQIYWAASPLTFTYSSTPSGALSERMRIDTNGNVGIGTTNPVARLQVAADQAAYNNDTGQLVLSGTTSTTKRLILGFNTTANKGFIQATDTSENYRDLLLNPNAGNVGIGTTGPTYKLAVRDSGAARVHVINSDNNAAGAGIFFQVFNGATQTSNATIRTNNAGTLSFFTGTTSEAENVVINANGNVGIGVTNPSSGILQTKDAGIASTNTYLGNGRLRIGGGSDHSSNPVLSVAPGEVQFDAPGVVGGRLLINSSGYVGIGTTNPEYKLHIPPGNPLYLNSLYMHGTTHNPKLSSGATGGSLTFEGGGLGEGKIYVQGAASGGNGYIEFLIGGTSRATINSSGHFVPGADNTYNLGSTSLRWANVYTADLHFSNKGKQNDVDGTWGDWTLQEGDENIFLLNHRNGKKYKIKLEEI